MTGVRYRLAMPDPHTHLLEVEVRVGSVSGPIELVMPSWTPGSYLMREFARHVQDFDAVDRAGERLRWRKTDKSTWRVEAASGAEVLARYRVYANELSVRTSHLDSSHAYVNGASVFMFARGREGEIVDLEVSAPETWEIATSLRRVDSPNPPPVIPAKAGIQDAPDGGLNPHLPGDDGCSAAGVSPPSAPRPHAPGGRALHRFRAADYDELVDSPLEIGTHRLLSWEQEGIPHEYAIWGPGEYDAGRIVADTRRVIDAAREMFGGELPYERFVFILHLVPEGRGGLEHASSCSLQVASSKPLRGPEYESFIALVAHEFFHVWNAKRIRPEPLGPFDYTRENYTRNLWVVEGITTYYTDLLLVRAGVMTRARYLERLGESISKLQALPGRHHQTLEESSFDAWIRFYRPDEHTPNSQVSYYHKGSLVALLLDMEIRRATEGERSLDDVMRRLWKRYRQSGVGFPEDPEHGVRAVAEEVSGVELTEFFDLYVRGTQELDYARALGVVGLEVTEDPPRQIGAKDLAEREPAAVQAESAEQGRRAGYLVGAVPPASPGAAAHATNEPESPGAATPDHPPHGWPPPQERLLGIRTRPSGGRIVITHVLTGGPAEAAGVNARDELLAIDGMSLSPDDLASRMPAATDGEQLRLTLSRRGRLFDVLAEAGKAAVRLRLRERRDPGETATHALESWLGRNPGKAASQLDPPDRRG